MSMVNEKLTTGISGLDKALKGILTGDNIVWRVDSIDEYQELVTPYCEAAVKNGRKLVYFRFARHKSLVTAEMGAEVHELDPEEGFENFIASIHCAMQHAGLGEYRPDLPEKGKAIYERLVRMVISRDESMQKLIARYFSLQEILDIRKRMIGTGLIGGKTVGMLLAQSIVKKNAPALSICSKHRTLSSSGLTPSLPTSSATVYGGSGRINAISENFWKVLICLLSRHT